MSMRSNLKQFVADIMAADHTRVVRLKDKQRFYKFPHLYKTGAMRQRKNNSLPIKYSKLPLHSLKAVDIKPIAIITVLATDPRHCTTTFYQ